MRPLLALPILVLAAACKVTEPAEIRSAPDAVLTFQARLARDDVAGELACFSQRFREQSGGLSLQGYATLRDRFLAPLGWFGRLLLCYDSLEDNLLGVDGADEMRARLVYSLFGHAFVIDAAAEASFAFPDPDGQPTVAPLARKDASLEPGGAAPQRAVAIEWNMPADAARKLVATGLAWAELGNVWRLEGLTPIDLVPKVEPPPAPPAAGRPPRVIRVPAIAVHEVRSAFGSVRLRVELELGAASACVRALPDGTLLVANGSDAPRLRWEASPVDPR